MPELNDQLYVDPNAFTNSMGGGMKRRYLELVTDIRPSMKLNGKWVTRREAFAYLLNRANQGEIKRNGQALNNEQAIRYAKDMTSPFQVIRNEQIRRNATLLPYDAERRLDSLLVSVPQKARVVVNDLMARGLTRDAGNIGTYIDTWQKVSDHSDAQISMGIGTNPEYQRQTYERAGVPLPIIQQQFQFDIREMTAAANNGTSLETTHAERAMEKVAQAEENMVMNGASVTFGGYTIYGITNHPDIFTSTAATLAGGGDFGTVTQIIPTFVGVLTVMSNANFKGPKGIYVSPTQYGQMLIPLGSGSDTSALQYCEKLPDVAFIRSSQHLADGKVAFVDLSTQTIDIAIAQEMVLVGWEAEGGAINTFRVFSCKAPRLKSNAQSTIGIYIVTAA
jgi:uncharacterized linocin/CFP29 family protein